MLLAPLTVEMLPKLPRQAPSAPFEAARNLYIDVANGRTAHRDAIRWSHNLPRQAGGWVRRALRTHASAGKARTKPGLTIK